MPAARAYRNPNPQRSVERPFRASRVEVSERDASPLFCPPSGEGLTVGPKLPIAELFSSVMLLLVPSGVPGNGIARGSRAEGRATMRPPSERARRPDTEPNPSSGSKQIGALRASSVSDDSPTGGSVLETDPLVDDEPRLYCSNAPLAFRRRRTPSVHRGPESLGAESGHVFCYYDENRHRRRAAAASLQGATAKLAATAFLNAKARREVEAICWRPHLMI